jgi:ABC-type transport system involved in cytochrome c biogenesis ATPase subunit
MSHYKFRKNANIGNLDAETDGFLDNCFYQSEIYNTLVKFDDDGDFAKRIIIGRTGSGKTALLKMIAGDSKIKKHDIIEAESTVFEHIKNNIFISHLMANNIDLRVFYKSLWLHVLLVKVIDLVYPTSGHFLDTLASFISTGKKKYNIDLAREYVNSFRDYFFNDNIVSEITDRMQSELSSSVDFNQFSASGKVNIESSEKIQRATASYVNMELLRKQKELIKLIKEESTNEKQVRIIISIDDLDKSWLSSSEIRYDFINALLDAFKELIDIKSVKILISIRTDIIMGIYQNNLRQEEKDRSLIIPVTWNKQEIRTILDSRIDYLIKNQYSGREQVCFSKIFNFIVKSERADEYILERTMLRPRDAIDFVNYCLSEGDGCTSLTEDLILMAEEKYYNSRKKALVKEWVSLYKHVEDYLDCISFVRVKNFTPNSLGTVKDTISTYLMGKSERNEEEKHDDITLNFYSLLKVWFSIGVVGIKKSDSVTIYSCFDKPHLDITDLDKDFEIHPLFYRY